MEFTKVIAKTICIDVLFKIKEKRKGRGGWNFNCDSLNSNEFLKVMARVIITGQYLNFNVNGRVMFVLRGSLILMRLTLNARLYGANFWVT